MTTYRRYIFQDQGKWSNPDLHAYALAFLERSCEQHWWFADPLVNDHETGVFEFSFTSAGRDQWFAHKRAMGLAVDLYYSLGKDERAVPIPMWRPLAPHDNRGRYRIRR